MTICEFIEKHEGRQNKPYKCPAGFNTIGVGWNIDAHPLPERIAKYLKQHGEITDEMIDELLKKSLVRTYYDCKYLSLIIPSLAKTEGSP